MTLPLFDQRIRDLEYGAISYLPDATSCTRLGPAGEEAAPKFMRPGGTPVMHSMSPSPFTPMDRGPGFTVRVPRPAEPATVGQRNAEAGE